MNKYIKCINYLATKGTAKINHANHSFFQHLIQVYNVLRSWNCSEDVCYAGMFHSIYGNESFKHKTETDRAVIKELIGEKAEEIVFLYNKDRFHSHETRVIHFANELDNGIVDVLDNVYDAQEAFEIYKYFRKEVGWKYNASGVEQTGWTKFRYDLDFKNEKEVILKNISTDILKQYKFDELLKLHSAYASANPYGTVHEAHEDFYEKGCVTIMFYLNHFWHIDYGGETVFYNKLNTEIIKSIIPKPSRAVIFDGTIKHCAREYRRDVQDLRMVLTFKYVKKSNEK